MWYVYVQSIIHITCIYFYELCIILGKYEAILFLDAISNIVLFVPPPFLSYCFDSQLLA